MKWLFCTWGLCLSISFAARAGEVPPDNISSADSPLVYTSDAGQHTGQWMERRLQWLRSQPRLVQKIQNQVLHLPVYGGNGRSAKPVCFQNGTKGCILYHCAGQSGLFPLVSPKYSLVFSGFGKTV